MNNCLKEGMENYKEEINKAADYIRKETGASPVVGIITGTGIGMVDRAAEVIGTVEYNDIPGFPEPTVESHRGRLSVGIMGGKQVAVMEGRFHLYEGYDARQVVFPVRVLRALGVRLLIVTNAAGGLDPALGSGDIMAVSDHLNLTGENPLVGPNCESLGPRFPDMIGAYDPALIDIADSCARDMGIRLRRGVYAALKGPSLETPAEMRYLKAIGADCVGFSTVPEVIAGIHGGMSVLGLSIITNVNNPDNPEPATVEGVLKVAGRVAPSLYQIIEHVVERVHEPTDS